MILNIARLLKLLEWSGVHARTLLPVGVVVAFFMPESGTFFKPAAPYILALLVSVAMLRLDILAVLKDAVRPRRLVRNICLALVLLIVTPYCLHSIATVAGLKEAFQIKTVGPRATRSDCMVPWRTLGTAFEALQRPQDQYKRRTTVEDG